LLVNDHGFFFDEDDVFVTLVTLNFGVPALKWKVRPRVVIENRGHPTLRIVAIGARRFPSLRKLTAVSVFVTVLTNLRGALELDFPRAHERFVTGATLDHAVSAEKRELGFRMVESVDVCPGPHVMASFASQRCAVGSLPRHAILKFTVVRILMAGSTTTISEAERHNFVGAACRSHLVAIGTGHRGVRPGQCETRAAMLRNRKSGTVKVLNAMATLAFVQVRSGGELSVMRILVTVRA
jgi:hypothetical protein